MIAVHHLTVVWSALFGFTAFCALHPIHVLDFYDPCQIAVQRFYEVNNYVFNLGYHDHQEGDDPDLDVFPPHIPILQNLNTWPRLQWLNGMTSLVFRTRDVMLHVSARLARYMAFLDHVFYDLHLDLQWANYTHRTNNLLRDCSTRLSQYVGQGQVPPNIIDVDVGPHITVFTAPIPADPLVFGEFYEHCQAGVTGYYDVHIFASAFTMAVENQDDPDENLVFPTNIPMLPNLEVENDQLLWLNGMTSLIFKNMEVIASTVRRLTNFMLWLNIIINNLHVPGALLDVQLPVAWHRRALDTNSLLLQCSYGLLQLLGLHPIINLVVIANLGPGQNR